MRWLLAPLMLALAACGAPAASPAPQSADGTRYVYYLHGRIVEDSGPEGVSPTFGRYDYPAILAALGGPGVEVISEVRAKDTDPVVYATRIEGQVRARIAAGVPPSHITIIGASKGSVIVTLVSDRLKLPGVRYVLLANCNDWLIRTFDPHLTGDVLSIYEASDDIGGSCAALAKRSPGIGRFSEIRLETGLGHGFIYRPLDPWVKPARDWAGR